MSLRLPCTETMRNEPLTERHLQALWYDGNMRPGILYAQDGTVVRVVDPGEWNLEAGPDFKNAVLEIGRSRRRVRGDVEMHLRPADWEAHRHGSDRAYDGVVAHVTWLEGPRPASLPPGAIALSMGAIVSAKAGFSPEQIDLSAYPFGRLPVAVRPCRKELGDNPDLAGAVLAAAGKQRLKGKAYRLLALLEESPGDRMQIFYEEFMSAFGYRRNANAFRKIAVMVPYRTVEAEPENVGLAFKAAAAFVDLDMRNSRPRNRPAARLAAVGDFFLDCDLRHYAALEDFAACSCKAAVERLASECRVGRGRAAAIFANVILPMALAEGRLDEVPDWFPPEDVSSPMRLTAFRMFGRDHNPAALYLRNGLAMQGLLQIYREYCLGLYPDCSGCNVVALSSQ